MSRFYLISRESWFQKSIHPLECPITIGRGSYNDLQIKHLSVSRQHARIVNDGNKLIVEDLDSQNGTLLNGHAVKKAELKDGDILTFGKVDFRVVSEPDDKEDDLSETEIFYKVFHERKSAGGITESIRLKEAIAKVPLFRDLPLEARDFLVRRAHLRIFEPTEFVFREGDRGKSIYIVLDGEIEIFTQDNYGTPVPLAKMGPNSFFGERAVLSGKPRCASAVAIKETLVCELPIGIIRDLLKVNPNMRLLLEEYSNKRFSSYVITRENLGITERRLHLRLNEELPVRLQFLREHPNGENESVSVDVVSTDISVGGVKLEVPDDLFKGVDCLGKQVRVAIELPKPLGEVRSLGIIRSVQASESGKKTNVGVEFYGMSPEDSQTLEKFFSWDSKV
ncbi:MAG: hypothetical protein DRG59_03530 [Deltaproteobacteria bacterium]|nr:MAG: hypothetical protein DRG59_03530 [Deltaproteobacteria bacterium]HEC31615.1 FHA domain-containing protein [Deltaproteobacteria bacterium]